MKTLKANNRGRETARRDGSELAPATGSANGWKRCSDEMPDDEMTVLLALDDGEVWTGFRDGDVWRYVSADLVECVVTHWMPFPEAPSAEGNSPSEKLRDRPVSGALETEKGN